MDDTNEPDTVREQRDRFGLVERYFDTCARLLPNDKRCGQPTTNKAFVATGHTKLYLGADSPIVIPEYLVVPLCSVHIEEEAEPLV